MRASRRESMYGVLWLPRFRLQAVLRGESNTWRPFALVDDAQRKPVVLVCNEAAARYGIEPGSPVGRGLARCPELEIRRPDPEAEESVRRLMLAVAWDWGPKMEATERNLLTLDLSGQGEKERAGAAEETRERLLDQELVSCVGLAATPALARIAAFAAERETGKIWELPESRRLEALDRLPLATAEMDGRLIERLQTWGLHFLGEFARFPRSSIAARLGEEGVEWWDLLNSRDCPPLRLVQPAHRVEERQELECEVDSLEPVLFLLRRFLSSMSLQLRALSRVAGAMRLSLQLASGEDYERRFQLPEPTREEEILFRVLHGHLEQIELRAPVAAVTLEMVPVDPREVQRGIFDTALRNPWKFEETIDRLVGIVGNENVGSPRLNDSHAADDFRLDALPKQIEEPEKETGPPVCGPVLQRWRPPEEAVVQYRRDGWPERVESSHVRGWVTGWRGPWRGSGHWWNRRAWSRIEWDVEIESGQVYRLTKTEKRWWVEGCYG
ncbi:MAG: DNA polymerase Y family protein [Verrucomicrobiota bacterium]